MKKLAVFLVAIGCLFGRVTFGATQLIGNGGFESFSTAPWQFVAPSGGVTFANNPAFSHTGTGYMAMGGINGPAIVRAFQVVTIPTNAVLASYSYFVSGGSADPASTSQLSALIISTNASQTIITNLHSDLNGTFGYVQRGINLAPYAGQTIELAFQDDIPNSGVGGASGFRIDDVSLLVFTADDIPTNDFFANATLLTTNTSVFATNVLATSEPDEPKHAGKTGGHSVWWKWVAPGNGELVLNTANSTINTLLAVYTGTSVSDLKQVAASDDVDAQQGVFTSKVKALVSAGTEYEIAVDGKNGDIGIIQLSLMFSADTKDPKVTITSPKSGAKLTNDTVLVQGTASDDLAVSLVQIRLENAAGITDYQNADGTNSWSATVNGLLPGPNTIRVRAFDTSSNEAPSVISTVNFVVLSPLTVTVSGTGTVLPSLNNTLQAVGSTITLTAKPGSGQVFSNWVGTGGLNSFNPTINFIMQSNMTWQANFIPNPFIPVAGTYQGLIYDTNGPTHDTSGFLTANVSSSGTFSAKIMLAGKSYALAGQFPANGVFSSGFFRKGLPPVGVLLTLDLAGGGITGQFTDGTWISELVAYRTLTTPGDTAGKYTLLLPGGTNAATQPGGDGYGTITVSSTGGIVLKGALGDGSKVTQKANLLANGQWPFYVSLYSGNGSIFGWLTFSNGVISGQTDWFKKSQAGGKIYPGGFTNITEAAGSVYSFTSGVPVLDFSTGQLVLSDGNLTDSFTNEITLDSASKVTSTNGTLKMTISTSTGSFKGSIGNPAGGKAISFTGVVLQKQNLGSGFFTGTTQTGRVFFGP